MSPAPSGHRLFLIFKQKNLSLPIPLPKEFTINHDGLRENGKQINFKSVKVSKGGFEFNEYKSFSFRDREKPLNDSIINEAISLDDILNVLSYEEIEKLLFNKVDEEDEEFYEERPIDEVKEESKPKAEAKPATKTQCPYNHKYGVDCEKHEDCDNCECWDACSYESVKS